MGSFDLQEFEAHLDPDPGSEDEDGGLSFEL